ncbi:dTDP-glucose 4,6-dehydratase [Candidatus Falkowbacteria bacterium]|nr:dTDP-glucose 4,6-dehydratase [Candidatus Falkowbacteria bacterium]
MKILVSGGAGFIGSNFIRLWFKNNPEDEIINLDLLTYAGNPENLKDLAGLKNYRFVKGDICDQALVELLAQEVELIVHFAAESHVDRSIKNSADFIKTNVEGTRVLLEAARKYNLRFHHVSTDEVFGSLKEGDQPFNEETAYDPRSPYSASKAASDHLVRAYFHTYGLRATISNCSNNYGPFQYPEKLIPLFITNLIERKKLPLYGDGRNIRDWIHVDDHNRGLELIIKKGRIGETYCLGGAQELRNIEIAKKIIKNFSAELEVLNESETLIEYIADRLGHDHRYAIDFSKAKRELGFEPEIKFEDGLRETIDWYKNNQTWWKILKNPQA